MARAPLALGTHGNITSRKLGDGKHAARCRYRDPAGRTRIVERRGPSKTKALAALQAELKTRAGAGSGKLRAHSRFGEAADLWLARIAERRRPTTAETYSRVTRNLVRPGLGQLRLREVTVPTVQALLDGLERRGKAAETRRTIRTVIKGTMQLAVQHEAVGANPVRDIDRIEGGPRSAARALTAQERRRLLAAIDADQAAVAADLPDLARFMLGTGCRIGEALAVRWGDLGEADVASTDGHSRRIPIISVTGNVVRVTGRGLVRHEGKTDTARRAIPLPAFVMEVLGRRRDELAAPECPIFPSGTLGYRDARNTARSWRRARRDAGFEWVKPHALRKTAATEWQRMGLDARMIADLLGHAHISMTQDVYLGRRQLHELAASAMDRAWGEGRPTGA